MFKTMLISYVLRPLIIPIFMMLQDKKTLELTNKIAGWGQEITFVLNSAVAICTIGGGFIIFMQYMQGNDQAQKNFIKLIIGLAIMGLISYVTEMFIVVPEVTTG